MKQTLVKLLRSLHLLHLAEGLRSMLVRRRLGVAMRDFESRNPGYVMPPWDIAYDAFGGLEPEKYRELGQLHAAKIAGHIGRHANAHAAAGTALTICDWGCGPMRVMRCLPEHAGVANHYIGLDYNPRTIAWASRAFPQFTFRLNALQPPLPLEAESVDVLYCISVFTHLSRKVALDYIADIHRILKPGGLLIATLHGEVNSANLTPEELVRFNRGEYVERGGVEEGKRIYVAYHPPGFVHEAFGQFEHLVTDTDNPTPYFKQEWWVFRK